MKKGFTLIELLIVIAIIAIIAGAVLVAMNPAKRICDANNGRRWEEVNSILNAIQQYVVDNTGDLPMCDFTTDYDFTATALPIGEPGSAAICDLSVLVDDGYLASLPIDPSGGLVTDTGYDVRLKTVGQTNVCIDAPNSCVSGASAPTITVCR